MIDRVLCARGNKDIFSDDYAPEQAIVDLELINLEAEELAVVFPPWHGGDKLIKILIGRLVRSGNAVLDVRLHDQILEPNMERVLQSHIHVREKATATLEAVCDEHKYQKVHILGISLGNVAASMVAGNFPDFSRATLVTPADDLAASMWEGLRTQNLRRSFEEQGISKSELVEAWNELAPKTYASAFKDKEVSVHLSAVDRVIPASNQQIMLRELQCAGSAVKQRESRLGHVATLTRFCIAG